MAKKVQYIKIARIDQNGNDLTNTLESLSQIKIPYTSAGSLTYKILTRADFPTYYLFQIDLNNSPDASSSPSTVSTTLDYQITASLDDSASGNNSTIGRFDLKTPVTGGQTITDFYNQEQQRIEINTLPREDLHFAIGVNTPGDNFEATLDVSSIGYGNTASIELYQSSTPYTTFTKLTSNPFLTRNNNSQTISRSVSIPRANISPGDIIFLGVQPEGSLGPGTNQVIVDLNNVGGGKFTGKLFVTSSAATGPTLENIVEPYLAKKFTNSDCDVLINNADQYQNNPFLQDLDFSSGAIVPVNYDQIVTGTAQKATVPESMFTMGGMINPNNSAINQVDKYNISASSYFGQTSGGTFVAYYKRSVTSGTPGSGYTTNFIVDYLITPDEEAIQMRASDESLDLLRRNFGSSANPLDKEYYPFGPLNGEVKLRAIPISGSETGSVLEYRGNTIVGTLGSVILVQSKTTGSEAPGDTGLGGAGIIYPASIELTSHSDLPSKARQILTENNVIPPEN